MMHPIPFATEPKGKFKTILNQLLRYKRPLLIVVLVIVIYYLLFSSKSSNALDEKMNKLKDDPLWASKVTKFQESVFSQGGQDGTLAYIFKNIGLTNKYYVEFGFSNDRMEGGTGANTFHLWQTGEWKGLLLDGFYENPEINLQKVWIKAETIVQVLQDRGVPEGADYISVDIDSADCFVAKEIMCELKPRVISVEYNSNLPLESTLANMGGEYMWNFNSGLDRLYGCGLGVHALIAKECGYSIVDVVPKLDVFMVRNDVLGKSKPPPLEFFRQFTELPIHFPTRISEAPQFLCCYEIYQKTGSFDKCSGVEVTKQIERLGISYWHGWYNPIGYNPLKLLSG